MHFLSLSFFFSCYVKRNAYLSLDQSVCDVTPSCFTGSDDLHYLEQQIQNGSFFYILPQRYLYQCDGEKK